MRSSATSVESSLPTSSAVRLRPSASVTVIDDAPSTTWAFVAMSPAASTTKPVPLPVPAAVIATTEGAAAR